MDRWTTNCSKFNQGFQQDHLCIVTLKHYTIEMNPQTTCGMIFFWTITITRMDKHGLKIENSQNLELSTTFTETNQQNQNFKLQYIGEEVHQVQQHKQWITYNHDELFKIKWDRNNFRTF